MRRIPFAAGDVDRVVAFCVGRSGYDGPLVRRLLLELTSHPDGVFVLGDDAGLGLVATIVDRAQNGADAAHLEVLGLRAPLAAGAFARLLIEPAVAFARAGERSALHVALPPARLPADGGEGALRSAGFAFSYDTYEMQRPHGAAPLGPSEPLPAGWSWAALDERRVEAAHAALVEMFRGAPSFSLGPLAGFRKAVASGATTWRVLLEGERLAGLVHVALHDVAGGGGRRRGEVRTIGRMPADRGRGLGERLLGEALRLLALGGAGDVELVAEAENVRAVRLYRRFGFEPTSVTPVFALRLR